MDLSIKLAIFHATCLSSSSSPVASSSATGCSDGHDTRWSCAKCISNGVIIDFAPAQIIALAPLGIVQAAAA